MPKEKFKTVYVCTSCGEASPRWMGRCPSCGEWNTMVEDIVKETKGKGVSAPATGNAAIIASRLKDISTTEEHSRIITGISELDRVLGGGIVLGSVVLLGGEPGAGKSTLLLQLCGAISRQVDVLYITGEESTRQIKLRATRLRVEEENIMLAAETDIGSICDLVEQTKPGIVVIDSIQTMHCAEISSSAGSVSQVKECTARLLTVAKTLEIPTFIVGHVNKDGAIAGPKVMEHIVDTVLYFEGDKMLPYRVLRAAKNRYGSTNEIGMFDMTGTGLKVIENPSKLLLEGRPIGVSGNCVACTMEGTRPILSEIQALVTKTGYFLGNLDVYINIVGGLELDETACDLSVCLAVVSSLMDKPVPDDMIAIGEVGLGGEVRNVTNLEYRLRESQRMGFVRAVVPKHSLAQIDPKEFNTMELLGVTYVKQAIQLL